MLPAMDAHVQPLPPAPTWRPGWPTLISVVAGLMLTTAMPPFRGTAMLAPLALALLFHALREGPRPAWLATWFGLAHVGPLLLWLFFLDPAKSIPTRLLVPLQALAAILFVAAHYTVFGVVVGWVRRRTGPRLLLALLPLLWMLVELLRSWGLGELGFPWCLTGAAWLESPVRPLYAAAGELGLGGATALLAATLVALLDLWRARRTQPAGPGDAPAADPAGAAARRLARGLIAATVSLWVLLALGSRPLGEDVGSGRRLEPLTVAAVQADVDQADKWDDARIDSTRIPYTRLTERAATAGAELVVWAETAIPAYVRYERGLLEWVRGLARENRVPILTGFPDARRAADREGADGQPRLEKFNAAGLFSATGTLLDTYGKHHLVPIGESMPFQRWIPALGRIDVGQAEWTRGAPPGPMRLATPQGEVPLFTLICYEAAFSHLARGAVRRGGRVLVNITNDGWFGHPSGPRQHAALARIRTVECGVPLVRSANNGISLIAGPEGRVLDRLALDRRGLVAATVPVVARGTLFVRFGWWPVLGFLVLWSAVALALLWRQRDLDPPDAMAGRAAARAAGRPARP